MGQIENVAQNPQQILVQQAPAGNPGTSLQDMLQLPAYPTDDGALLHGISCSSEWQKCRCLISSYQQNGIVLGGCGSFSCGKRLVLAGRI